VIIDEPSKVNEDPLGVGWFFKIKPDDLSQMDDYMDERSYNKLIA
jgi:glycine cleavage system H protein